MGNLVRENRTQGSEGGAFPMKRNYETNFKLGVKEMPLPTMKGIFMSMLGLMMMTTCSVASHPLDPRLIPKYDGEPSGEPLSPVDYEENTEN